MFGSAVEWLHRETAILRLTSQNLLMLCWVEIVVVVEIMIYGLVLLLFVVLQHCKMGDGRVSLVDLSCYVGFLWRCEKVKFFFTTFNQDLRVHVVYAGWEHKTRGILREYSMWVWWLNFSVQRAQITCRKKMRQQNWRVPLKKTTTKLEGTSKKKKQQKNNNNHNTKQ